MKTKNTKVETSVKVSSEAAASEPEVVPTLPPGNPPPASRAPSPPDGWKARKLGRVGARMSAPQVDNATGAARELQGEGTYADDLGPKAPKPEPLANTLVNAAAWRDQWAIARRWLAYTAEQRASWEAEAVKQTQELQPLFDYASARDPDVAKRYPALKQFLGARSAIGQRSARTRKTKKIEKEKLEKAKLNAPPDAPPAPPPNPPSQMH